MAQEGKKVQENLRQIDTNVSSEHRVGLRHPVCTEEGQDEERILVPLT